VVRGKVANKWIMQFMFAFAARGFNPCQNILLDNDDEIELEISKGVL
jgi:hypothetical protein